MSVFTHLSYDQLASLIGTLNCGTLKSFSGIEAGVVNSNFFVSTSTGEYVLTLFEHATAEELPFFIALNAHLASHGLPCAAPQADVDGATIHFIAEKPAVLFTRLPGHSPDIVNRAQLRAIGRALATLHLEAKKFEGTMEDTRGEQWLRTTGQRVMPKLDNINATLLSRELAYLDKHPLTTLPSGVIHADLFRDNTLFEGDRLSGLIDFYFACNGPWIYDLAIVCNDWCKSSTGEVNYHLTKLLTDAYQEIRPLETREKQAWPAALRRAALRFWLSRLEDLHFPATTGPLVLVKNPDDFAHLLMQHISMATGLP